MNQLFKNTLKKRLRTSQALVRHYGGPSLESTEHFIDLRSDTVTRPSQKMKDAMVNAPLGDDCYGDDPTVNKLQRDIAKLFGKEESLFVPSGTMSNLICMMINVRIKGEGAIIGHLSHVLNIERGGMSAIGGIHPLVEKNEPDATISIENILNAVPPDNYNLAQPRVIALESPHNLCDGKVLRPEYITQVKQIANEHNLRMHIDAARGLNAAVFLKIDPAEMVKDFDTVNFCLSKGMACPVGSMVIGTHKDI